MSSYLRRNLIPLVVGLVAVLGVYVAGRVSTPVSRLTRATRQIAAGRLDVRIAADTADELRRLVDDFNTMAATLAAQRDELARSQQLKAWAEMARQVAHEIKNPLTPMRLGMQHLRRARQDPRVDFDTVLDENVTRMLGEIAEGAVFQTADQIVTVEASIASFAATL